MLSDLHAAPFAFAQNYEPASGIIRMQCGTQPILSMQALDAAMDVWADVNMVDVYAKAQKMCALFVELAEARLAKHGVQLYGARDFSKRGSHVSLRHEQSYAVMQALISKRVIGDFRAPDMMRFGFAPLYNSYADVWDAVEVLRQVLDEKLWDVPKFRERKAVT